jgi:hypothetical protein
VYPGGSPNYSKPVGILTETKEIRTILERKAEPIMLSTLIQGNDRAPVIRRIMLLIFNYKREITFHHAKIGDTYIQFQTGY